MVEDNTRAKEEIMTARRAQMLGLRYFDSSKLDDPPLYKDLLSTEEMYKNHVVVLTKNENSMVVGLTSKTPQQALDNIASRFMDMQISFVLISDSGHKSMMLKYDPPEEVIYQDVTITSEGGSETIKEVSESINKVLPDDMFDYLIRQSLKLEASDVHLESSRENTIRIRFRVHGVLHDIATLSLEKYRQLMSTVATKGDISTSSPQPQTGHITHVLDNNEVNIRIETVPTLYGQDVVLRIFTLQKDLMNLETLGLDNEELSLIEDVVDNPSGMVISVGPTGSGKTTTLYSIINKLNRPDLKIITLEDPVEYSLPGLVQIPVKTMKQESFADGLRAVLRMDPDVIMVGEIRDADTANTALQAALSGHLVLTTFHAGDASSALARILTFTKGNPMFTSALRLVIGQRLVRRLDDETKEAYKPDEHVLNNIVEVMGDRLQIEPSQIELYRAVPSKSSPFGYNGRTAVVELMQMSPEIERLIHKHGEDLVADDVREIAQKDGMKTLLQDAIEKVLDGETTIEEIYRVI